MNSLVKVFSNFKEFYNEINGATLTGAIDVIVVEQPDGTYHCSPFHVRFGKLGVLRSREKVVDILINGEPVDIHMKLGDSGEAFFVEECPDSDGEELPANLATSPIPTNFLIQKFEDEDPLDDGNQSDKSKVITASDELQIALPLPRRNSIDFSKETAKEEDKPKFENQVSDYSYRRHTDNTLERRNLNEKLKEYTTQKLRQEWAEHEEIFNFDNTTNVDNQDQDWCNSTQTEEKLTATTAVADGTTVCQENDNELNGTTADADASVLISNITVTEKNRPNDNENVKEPSITVTDADSVNAVNSSSNVVAVNLNQNQHLDTISTINSLKEESKGKKKRRKKTQMKKKNAQRKSSSSSSLGSNGITQDGANNDVVEQNVDEGDTISISVSNKSAPSSEENSGEQQSGQLLTAMGGDDDSRDVSEICQTSPITPSNRIPDLDIHFFSDTEVTTSAGPCSVRNSGRPSTPIQSDSELEMSMRDKDNNDDMTASWKWGELPTPEMTDAVDGQVEQIAQTQAQRKSMLSGMFNFMKKTSKMRQQANCDGGLYLSDIINDPQITAMYLKGRQSKETSPLQTQGSGDEDRESGNGTSLPLSPSSLDGQKSSDSDYEDGKPRETKYLDFVAMSLCGLGEKGVPTDEEFDRHLIKYPDVCANPSLFASPNLVVRLNGKFYSWAAACPIVMTIITFQKPLTNDAIEQLMTNTKLDLTPTSTVGKNDIDEGVPNAGQTKRSWWYWRRSQTDAPNPNATLVPAKIAKTDDKQDDVDHTAVATTQTSRPNTPDDTENTLSKTDSTLNAENTSALVENLDDLSESSREVNQSNNERYKKSLRLSSDAIKQLNLKEGMNELEFSVTTAYQGTTRCKCCLFRWRYTDKVVISDIDGTITRSDVLGHLLPMVGKDWAQLGVAQLFSKIEQNGYKLLYLSARAIGQSRVTREYLRSIRQGDVKLPDGPLLLNPTSLISAFHREVIEKKPEQFKIACLSDVRDLFPDKNPFYAGYGNRINDVWAYRAVGIPIMRIFTINTKGELKHELTQTFQSSYCSMTNIVDQLFPPIKLNEESVEFSNFNYWRDPIPELDLDLLGGNNNTTTTTTTNPNNSSGSNAVLASNGTPGATTIATSNADTFGSANKILNTIPEVK